jgi:hypothetical protein
MRKRTKTLTIAAVILAVSAGAAFSQGKGHKTPLQAQEEEKARRVKEVDKEYEAAMKRSGGTTSPAAASDPWKNVRPSGTTSNPRN